MTDSTPAKSRSRRLNWWPPLIWLVLLTIGLTWMWNDIDVEGTTRLMVTVPALLVTALFLLGWWLTRRQLSWAQRGLGVLAAIVAVVLLSFVVRIRDFDGDMVPILDWTWSTDPADRLADRSTDGRIPATALAPAVFEWPQYLGPSRDAQLPAARTRNGAVLASDWQVTAPEELWRRPVGAGWAGFAVVGRVAVTLEQRGDDEVVAAYDLMTGEPYWTHADATRHESPLGGVGPRTTPSVVDGKVYTVGGSALLNCLDLATGEVLWSHDLLAEHGVTLPEWGKSTSPLVTDDMVVVPVGGPGKALAAYHKETGELLWTGGDGGASYSSPLRVTLAGRDQLIVFNANTLSGHDPMDGRQLWSHPWQGSVPTISQPLQVANDLLLVSSGYGIGSSLLRFTSEELISEEQSPSDGQSDTLSVEELWHTPRMKAKFTNLVQHEDAIYGLDDGVLACVRLEDGERCWKRGRYGHGQVIKVGDRLLVSAEDGEVLMLELTPEEHRVLTSFHPMDGKNWNPPVLVGDILLLRNDREAAAFRLPLEN